MIAFIADRTIASNRAAPSSMSARWRASLCRRRWIATASATTNAPARAPSAITTSASLRHSARASSRAAQMVSAVAATTTRAAATPRTRTRRRSVIADRLRPGSGGRRRAAHVGHREPGDPLVVLRQGTQLVLGDVAVEVVERPVAHQLFHLHVDDVRRMGPVRAHDSRRRLAPQLLVPDERVARVAHGLQAVGERAGIDRALRRAVRA